MKRSSVVLLLTTAAALFAAKLPQISAESGLADTIDAINRHNQQPDDATQRSAPRSITADIDAQLADIGVLGSSQVQAPATNVEKSLVNLLKPLVRMKLPWSFLMTQRLRLHLNNNVKASKRRFRRSSVDGNVTAAAAAAASASDGPSQCGINLESPDLVDGWASNSSDTYGTVTLIYNRVQLLYQDNKASENAVTNPDTMFAAAARRQTGSSSRVVPTTYVIVSVSRGWLAMNTNCNDPPSCTNWGSQLYKDAGWKKSDCKRAKCWEQALCRSSSGACFMHVTVLDWDPVLGYTSESSHAIRLLRDGVKPAVNGITQRAAFAMCSPCTTTQCT